MAKTRVALVYGGRSGEHEVSVRSAESIAAAIDQDRFELCRYFIAQDGAWEPAPIVPSPGANPGIDVVFPIVHGTFGEDGTLQGLFELAALPYVGAGVMSSAVSMDKSVMKLMFRAAGLPTSEFLILERGPFDPSRIEAVCGLPAFVKPANLGSSLGISKAHDREELKQALELAWEFDSKVVVERTIAGREFECGVLGNKNPQASIPCEVIPSKEFYDYEDKYILNKARFDLPPNLPSAEIEAMRRLAVATFEAVHCAGLARVDFLRENADGRFYVNEINTLPGFTSISMYPRMWEHTGVPYRELISRLIDLALERHAQRMATRFSR